ncbi:hypothetical protein M011DRAFT_222656 [Sporormia fimetaria CBS 119925]|uniref:Uncharacterized protein n=1 Tax=Sporormia fimetaria CBS 119925 TaxID=1340428 RepID=A0A6A6V0E8_9PLEO|nr:hypothetical protein M011DRAFT_222656 [Sporormia fimetaria CBS 119925]
MPLTKCPDGASTASRGPPPTCTRRRALARHMSPSRPRPPRASVIQDRVGRHLVRDATVYTVRASTMPAPHVTADVSPRLHRQSRTTEPSPRLHFARGCTPDLATGSGRGRSRSTANMTPFRTLHQSTCRCRR